jgi:hypothetical protein
MMMKTMTIDDLKTMFTSLTDTALPEADPDRFIQFLQERAPYGMDLINHRVPVEGNEARDLLLKESRILERLKAEKLRLLTEMEQLSKNRKAAKAYSPTFPFPPVPAFLDKKG